MKRLLKFKNYLSIGLFFLLLAMATESRAATITNIATGSWGTPATWVGGVIPAPGDDVVIKSDSRVTVNGNYSCNSLIIGDGTIINGAWVTFSGTNPSLTVAGNITVGASNAYAQIFFESDATVVASSIILHRKIDMTLGGVLKTGSFTLPSEGDQKWFPGTGTVELTATNTLPATLFTSFINLVISGGTTTFTANTNISNNFTIKDDGAATVDAGVTLTVDGPLKIESTSSGTGSLLVNGTLTGTGTRTVERYYSGNQWHLVSSPVTGAVSELFTGLYLQTHDEVLNTYSDVTSLTDPLTPGQGFALWNQNGAATASYTGTLAASVTKALTRSAPGNTRGWNLVGNPYPSSIDWEAASGWTKTNVDASTYCFNGTGGNWAIWNGTTGTNGATQNIASGQGFFVAVSDNGSTTGSLGFTNDVRVHDNTTFFKGAPTDIVKLKVSGNNFSDETAIYFREEATTGFDGQMDAYQLPNLNESAPYIYSTANQGMAINVLPEVSDVPLNVKVGIETGTYTIETVSNGEFDELHLQDLSTGVTTDLNLNSYTFDYIPGIENRFKLVFGPTGVDDVAVDLYNVYSYNKDVFVTASENTKGTIAVYDMMGREIAKQSINGTLNVSPLPTPSFILRQVVVVLPHAKK